MPATQFDDCGKLFPFIETKEVPHCWDCEFDKTCEARIPCSDCEGLHDTGRSYFQAEDAGAQAKSIPVVTNDEGPKVDVGVQDGEGRQVLSVAALRPLYEAAVTVQLFLKCAKRFNGVSLGYADQASKMLDAAIALAEGKTKEAPAAGR
jgi:hypothetical protein